MKTQLLGQFWLIKNNMKNYFKNTPEGNKYIKRLCDIDDVKNGVEVEVPKIPEYTEVELEKTDAGVWGFISSLRV